MYKKIIISFLAKYIRKIKIHIKTQSCTQEKKTILIFTEIYENAITSRKNMRIPTNIQKHLGNNDMYKTYIKKIEAVEITGIYIQ